MNFSHQILLVHELVESGHRLKEILAPHSYRIFESCNVEEAESILAKESINLVITSLDLPARSGFMLVEKIKSMSPKIPVIIITKKRRIAAFLECSEIGGDGVITIPFNAENIANTVKNTLELANRQSKFEDKNKILPTRYLAGYTLKGVLGKGSMGIVYLAEKVNSGTVKPYALKVLQEPAERTEEQKRELLERFLREAEAASCLRHPNIVKIIDFGIAEEELTPYIVMDFIPGRSLNYFIGKSGLNTMQKAMIIRQVAYALETIHSHNICHRDIKPENIIMDENLTAKVTDFGVARVPNSDLTQVVKILGTPAYMAPEAFVSARVGLKADIFSLGVVAYELFLGIKPFYSESINGYRRKIRNERPQEPKKIDPMFPPELQCILAKSLKKKPNERFSSATDFIKALDQFLESVSSKVDTTVVDLLEYFDNSDHSISAEFQAYEKTELDWQ